MSSQDRQTIARLKGRIAYLQEALAQAKAEIMDYRENHQHQKELSRLESENAVLKELLAKYEKIDLEKYEAVMEENKKLKQKQVEEKQPIIPSQMNLNVTSQPAVSADDWFLNNLKSQSSTKQSTKKEER
ncbi:hypothetical protein [Bacillus kexueae]|uniref:hypothetical protein n=1 Tax=Aeribacillus kexueae TaxID=2078952 RepID=UPI001FAF4C34|nr:hypothetical protein [Bacillus kexueae]